jgi:hypothetical protein
MKYFIDCEFIEGFHKPAFGKRRHFIDLISIAVVCEDGREYYAISSEYDYKNADEWVKNNVIIPAYINRVHGDARNMSDASNFHKGWGKSNAQIAQDLLEFFKCGYEDGHWYAPPGIEVYGYYADYDWVLFCSLFGRMIDLPSGFPMYCRDLKQTMDEANLDGEWKEKHCPEPENSHVALADARWNYQLFMEIEKEISDYVLGE